MARQQILQSNQSGFSLLEIMIATLIFAFIALATSETVRQNRDNKAKIDEELDTYQAIRAAISILRRDLSNPFHLNDSDFAPYSHRSQLPADFDYEKFKRGVRTYFLGGENNIHFTSLTHFRMFAAKPESEQAEISYYTEPDKGDPSILNLYKRESPIIDDQPREGGNSYLLLSDLAKFQMRYYNIAADQWTTTWDSDREPTLDEIPEIIEVTATVNLRHPSIAEKIDKIELTISFHPNFSNSYGRIRLGALPALKDVLKPVSQDPNAIQNPDAAAPPPQPVDPSDPNQGVP